MDKIKPQIKRINKNEVLLRDHEEWLHFKNPYRLITAGRLDEVLPALREVEQLSQANQWYGAGFLSYEAAPAFDAALHADASTAFLEGSTALHSARKNDFPYLWFGLYLEPQTVVLPKAAGNPEVLEWRPTTDCETYNRAIAKIKGHIAEGRTYQVNYTLRLQTEFHDDPWGFFLNLAQKQNRYAAFINTGSQVICSASPEHFFRLDGNTITCRHMKGTTARGRTTS
jgi:para-aminobenzoate synthetase/4-amino-4-deoxychorismate lyase